MSEKRMLIVPTELTKKIDDNRGDMSQAEFIDFLIDSCLKEEAKEQPYITRKEIESLKQDISAILLKEDKVREQKYVTKEEIQALQQDTRRLLKSFLDFFIGYGLELGKQSPGNDLKELAKKLDGLEGDLTSEEESREVKIKWK